MYTLKIYLDPYINVVVGSPKDLFDLASFFEKSKVYFNMYYIDGHELPPDSMGWGKFEYLRNDRTIDSIDDLNNVELPLSHE